MKRMTENPIGYYTIKEEDMKNFVPDADPGKVAFSFTPSDKFIEVLKEFRDVLIADWAVINPAMINSYNTYLSILYPTNIADLPEADDAIGYLYTADHVTNLNIRPIFYKQGGKYIVEFLG